MSYRYKSIAPENTYKVVDSQNTFWGILSNADISKCTLYYHKLAAICRSRSSKKILLYKDRQGDFDFTVWATASHNKSFEASLEEQARLRLGESPLAIKPLGLTSPSDTYPFFISYYEICYSANFIKNVICRENLFLLEIEEFHNLCAFFPEDIVPLLRETAHSIFNLFSSETN